MEPSKRVRKLIRRFAAGNRLLPYRDYLELKRLGYIEYYHGPGPDGTGWVSCPVLSAAGQQAIDGRRI